MDRKIMIIFIGAFFIFCKNVGAQQRDVPKEALYVPIGGNTWQEGEVAEERDLITKEGIKIWQDAAKEFKTFIRVAKKGSLAVWLKATANGESRVTADVAGKEKKIIIQRANSDSIYLGEWNLKDTGYVAIQLKANKQINLSEVGGFYIAGSSVDAHTHFVRNDEGNFFYWGRRGPSTHLNYQTPADKDISYYYNEVTVTAGNDVVGSYFMANGFNGGYFGMQVNSDTERRILFSVWSPFETDNPDEIPEDHRIKLLKKGEGVHTGEFGNEGAGGQSYFKYNWKAGTTYKFLLRGQPAADNYTNYTAWFYAPELGEWKLIASFGRPQTNTWLKSFHSFLENFSPKQGVFERKVYFGNQWVADKDGNWYEINKARFSADNTARVGYRLDYSGGSEQGKFFLRNFGFFSKYTPIGTRFEKPLSGNKPVIDFHKLP